MAISPMQASVIQKELVDLLLLLQTLSSPQLRALCQFVQNYILQDTAWVKALSPVIQRLSVDRLDKLIALVNSGQVADPQQQFLRQELESVSQEFQIPPRELENGFGILIQLYQLFNMLQNLSIIQLMKMFEVVPQGPPIQQMQLLQQIQQLFGMLKGEVLQNIHKSIQNHPPGQDQQILKQMLNLPSEYFQLYQPLRTLLQLDIEELTRLQEVLPKLHQTQMLQLLQILQLQPMDVLELRTMFHLDKGITDDLLSLDDMDSYDMDIPMEPGMPDFQQPQPDKAIRLQIVEQPPEKSVYKRNLKPNPVVMLVGDQKMNDGNLYIVPTLIRTDTFQEEAKFITGNKPVRVTSGRIIPFKKLKITTTSHQQGETLFCVRFELRRYAAEDQYEVLDTIHSNPISVLSHSTQMKPAPTQAPTISDIIPEGGPTTGGTRVAIIGSNFIDSPAVRIKFDNLEVMPQFHGAGTLVCHSPQHPPGTVVVRVCNANKKWSESSANFTFYDENVQDRHIGTTVATTDTHNFPRGMPEAAFQGNFDQLTRMHGNGGNVNATDQRTYTALQYATSSNNAPIANYLLENGADANYQDRYGSTALHWATLEGNESMVQLLIEHGANMNIPNYEGATPLSIAIREQHERIANYLMDNGAIINTSSIDGHTPLHLASALGNIHLINLLIQRGAFVNAVDFCNETPLHWAVRENQLEAVNHLITQKARLDIQNEDYETPLMLAVYLSHEAIANELIQRGASIRIKDSEGWTILHEAVNIAGASIVKALVQRGADIFASDANENTPYQLAMQSQNTEIIRFFREQFGGNQQISELEIQGNGRQRNIDVVSVLKEEASFCNIKGAALSGIPFNVHTATV